jgi:hypothetical protein
VTAVAAAFDRLFADLRRTGDDFAARFILSVEVRRMQIWGDDYEPFRDDEWPCATADELARVRRTLADATPEQIAAWQNELDE